MKKKHQRIKTVVVFDIRAHLKTLSDEGLADHYNRFQRLIDRHEASILDETNESYSQSDLRGWYRRLDLVDEEADRRFGGLRDEY